MGLLTFSELLPIVAAGLSSDANPLIVRYANSFRLDQRRAGRFVEPGGVIEEHKQSRVIYKELTAFVVVEKLLNQTDASVDAEIEALVAEIESLMRRCLPGAIDSLAVPGAFCRAATPFFGGNALYSVEAAEADSPYFVGGFQATFIATGGS